MGSLLRRFDDAACAFCHGHSRRDLDRVRRRRLLLLGQRLVASRERRAEWAESFDDVLFFQSSADAAFDLLEHFHQSGGRLGDAALLEEIEIDRARLCARRVWAHLCSRDGTHENVLEKWNAAPILSNKRYGKLFEGLGEKGVLRPFVHKLRIRVPYWHRVFSPLFRRFHLAFERLSNRASCGPP
ncbi:hypothetical protein [Phyllobacterium phragmitis]|uniref:hypothetical protein n=1 Tax=Phyllobacterium phragmitis TaxID=2670329 RepID=UPI0011B27679|nr:hypothetical protein [Phyllobacterium phragmitis]